MMLQNGRSCLAVGINHYRMHWKKSYSCFYLCSFSFPLVGDVTLKILCWDFDEKAFNLFAPLVVFNCHINHKIRQGVLGDWFEIRPARDCSIKSHDNQEIDTMDAKSITSPITLQPKLLYLHNTHTIMTEVHFTCGL
jgi:hypothetical protein